MFRIEDLFDCFPHQEIKANELIQGDIAYVNRNWIFVESAILEKENYNNGMNCVISHGKGMSYLPPEHQVKIIPRNLLDRDKINKFLANVKKDKDELEKLREEERLEEIRNLRAQREEIDRELKAHDKK